MKSYSSFRSPFVRLSSQRNHQFSLQPGAILLSCAVALIVAGCGGGSSGTGGGGTAPPSNLSYPIYAIKATVGAAISADTPTVSGTVSNYSVSPSLPAGLSISSSAGTISGTPTAASTKTSYTVTASNSGGSTTASLTITVNPVAPSKLSYAQLSIVASVGTPITSDTPAVTGTVSSYTISPALPAGLNIDASSGAISGTPTAVSAQTTYTVTASNAGGDTTAQIQVTVLNGSSTLAFLGHVNGISTLLTDGTHVMSMDSNGIFGNWVLWDYANAAVIASGNGAVTQLPTGATTNNGIGLAGPIAVVWDGVDANIYSSSSGKRVAAVPASCWYQLATDGSYIATGSSTALTVYSSAGTQEFTQSGNYCAANVFATPTQVHVALGAKGMNVIENLAVPSGTSTVSPSFNGTFNSWFIDGNRFLSTLSTTILAYSTSAVQQGIISAPSTFSYLNGQGNWISFMTTIISGSTESYSLSIYAVGSTTPAQTYSLPDSAANNIASSGLELAVFAEYSQQMSVIDLSGSTPAKTDYTLPAPLFPDWVNPAYVPATFAASSASTWLLACNNSVIFDGASINSAPRTLNYGNALSIVAAGGTAAVSTASGQVLVFDLSVPKAIGNIPFYANKLQISSDGSVLAAADLDISGQPIATLSFYSLPSMKLTGTFTWDSSSGPYLTDFNLSGSGAEVGELIYANTSVTSGTAELIHPDGSVNVILQQNAPAAPLLSPDGTLAAVSNASLVDIPLSFTPQSNIYKNGALTTAVTALAMGWVDDNDLLAQNWSLNTSSDTETYTGSTVYDATGATVSTLTPKQLPRIYGTPTFLPGQLVFGPDSDSNAIYSLSTGTVTFQGPFNSAGIGAAGATDIVYETTNGTVTMVPFQ